MIKIKNNTESFFVILEDITFSLNLFPASTIYQEVEELEYGWIVQGPIYWQVGEKDGSEKEERFLPGNAQKEEFSSIADAITFVENLE